VLSVSAQTTNTKTGAAITIIQNHFQKRDTLNSFLLFYAIIGWMSFGAPS
jgi:hypothetical protein